MTVPSMRVLVMAAGTGGHVIPGLAIAKALQDRGHSVQWLGTPEGMENRLVPPSGIALNRLSFSGLRGKGFMGALTGGFRLLQGFWQSLQILRQQHIDVVLGMGGYVCFPGGLAAALLGKPLVLMNADAALLLSNKMLLPLADAIAFGFESADAQAIAKAVVSGNPVRANIRAIAEPEQRYAGRMGPIRVLVVGGSSGAKFLNDSVPLALGKLPSERRPVVIHQTGVAHFDGVRARYAELGVQADVRPFIDDMAQALSDCDVMLCRAGAVTLSEICAAGVASMLVPLVIRTTQHQQNNAQWLGAQGAAIHLPQATLDVALLAEQLASLNRGSLLGLASKAKALDRPQATERVVGLCEHLYAAKNTDKKGNTTQ
jgi:UDP-N-acetylglucosamine--N-acetylmuramyl-(pentapeptide) pyrophosphoryl-undecaprenol N-acetylglucosamine transferase